MERRCPPWSTRNDSLWTAEDHLILCQLFPFGSCKPSLARKDRKREGASSHDERLNEEDEAESLLVEESLFKDALKSENSSLLSEDTLGSMIEAHFRQLEAFDKKALKLEQTKVVENSGSTGGRLKVNSQILALQADEDPSTSGSEEESDDFTEGSDEGDSLPNDNPYLFPASVRFPTFGIDEESETDFQHLQLSDDDMEVSFG